MPNQRCHVSLRYGGLKIVVMGYLHLVRLSAIDARQFQISPGVKSLAPILKISPFVPFLSIGCKSTVFARIVWKCNWWQIEPPVQECYPHGHEKVTANYFFKEIVLFTIFFFVSFFNNDEACLNLNQSNLYFSCASCSFKWWGQTSNCVHCSGQQNIIKPNCTSKQ